LFAHIFYLLLLKYNRFSFCLLYGGGSNLPKTGNVKLTLYNILGQEIRILVNEYKESGVHTINLDASELNSGMYIYKLESGSFVQTRKMMLLK